VRIRSLLVTVIALAFMAPPAFGCKCVTSPPEIKTAQDLAHWYADRSDVVFEGTVEHVELKWALMEAKVGTLVPADLDQNPPLLEVTFDKTRSYKGMEQSRALVTTGLGGGDCGFDFEIGKRYLVYASPDELGHLSSGICSGTGLLEESQSNLSYLRREQDVSENPKQNGGAPRTKLCGHVVGSRPDFANSQVFLLRVGNKSPIPSDEGELAQDGSFCTFGAKPGNYYLAFVSSAEDSPTSFVLFPGVTSSAEATVVELKSGQAHSDLVFNVQPQPTFSVSGNVLTPSQSGLPPECKVFMWSADLPYFLKVYSQNIAPSGSFDFPNVLPGKYWAVIGVDNDSAPDWLTKKIEVNVSAKVNGLSLELLHK
jgi:hypothetical protein